MNSIEQIKQLSEENNNCPICIYRWTTPPQYRKGIHTDLIEYTDFALSDIGEDDITDFGYMEAEELNATLYANSSYTADEEDKEIIIMINPKKQ